jgi:aryl-alcohol dehydrogenase-like predicted oxidoreductase
VVGEMRYRTVGSSGLVVSAVGLGCNSFGSRIGIDEASTVVGEALECGITLFDTADIYGDGASEEILGRALGRRRDRVVVATKFGVYPGSGEFEHFEARASRRHVYNAVDSSLRRLGADYIDLYQMHRPDGVTPISETLEVLGDLVKAGKIRYFGSSNLTAWQIVDADWTSRINGTGRFISAQNEYSLTNRSAELELLPACQQAGIGVLAYSPLDSGLLSGLYTRGSTIRQGSLLATHPDYFKNADFDCIDALNQFAHQRGVALVDVAIGSLVAQPSVASAIVGATKPEHVRANVQACAWRPSAGDLDALLRLTCGTQSRTYHNQLSDRWTMLLRQGPAAPDLSVVHGGGLRPTEMSG